MFVAAYFVRVHHAGWAHPWLGLAFWFAFVALIATAVWLFVRSIHTAPVVVAEGPPGDPAMDILRARFARGEIEAAEFTARAAQLSGEQPVAPAAPEAPAPEAE